MATEPADGVELSPLKRAFLALEQMQAKLDAVEQRRTEPIAIVGAGCRFPGADGVDEFWDLLRNGVDATGEVPADRWDVEHFYDPDPDAPGKISTRRGGFLRDVDLFDPLFFGISPREAVSMDPQQRLLLEVAWQALEHGAIAPASLAGSRTGVFVGLTSGDYAQVQLHEAGVRGLDAYYASGIAHSVASGRISYVLGLTGPSVTLDTACSSSLVAIHLAVQSLRTGECSMALAGGVSLMLSPETSITLSKYHMLAPDGRCKAFDAAADGFGRAEGCGLLVLKRLADAQAAGDRVLAVIRGSAVNQDGASSGLTAPNGPSQAAVIRAALDSAAARPSQVGYVEAHGTGTALGDPIEVQAIVEALGPDREQPILVGSAKTNVGHLEGAAGVVGMLKAALVLHHGEVPPHLHLHTPNPHIDWDDIPVRVPTSATPFPAAAEAPLVGVSSFGFSGTNAHVVLEAAPAAPAPDPDDRPQVLALSAPSEASLTRLAGDLATALAGRPAVELADVAATLNGGRSHFAHRLGVVSASTAELGEQLRQFASGERPRGVTAGQAPTDRPRVAFLCSGQGSQFVGMAAGLYGVEPVFRGAFDRVVGLLDPLVGVSLGEVVFGGVGGVLSETWLAQPALFAVEWALGELWRSWGVVPDVVLGHSLGELVGAVLAGVVGLEDGCRLVAARGRLMGGLPSGGVMFAVSAGVERVSGVVDGVGGGGVVVAAVNGPLDTVVSGEAGAVGRVVDVLVGEGVGVRQLVVSHAFHSPLMDPVLGAFGEVVGSVGLGVPRVRLVSNVTGGVVGEEVCDPGYWVRQVREPVLFGAGVECLVGLGVSVFVELGPHPVLLGLARGSVDGGVWVPSLRRGRDDREQMLEGVASLYAAGVPIDWNGVAGDRRRRRLSLPGTPQDRKRYWVAKGRAARPVDADDAHPLLGQRLSSPQKTVSFESRLERAALAFVDDHRVAGVSILPATGYLELATAAATAVLGDAHAIEDVVIYEPLVVGDDGIVVQTLVEPDDRGARIEVHSRVGEQAGWQLHATARAVPTTASPPDTRVDLDALRPPPATEVDGADHDRRMAAVGLDFGPSLHGVRRVHAGDGSAVGEIVLPGDARELAAYRFHPALLDACLQVAMHAADSGDGVRLPLTIDRYTVHRAPPAAVWSHVAARDRGGAGAETIVVDVRVHDGAGLLVAEIEGVALKRVSASVLQSLGGDPPADQWLYDVAWTPIADVATETVVHGDAASVATLLPAERAVALRRATGIDADAQLMVGLEQLSTAYVVRAMRQLGVQLTPGTVFDAGDLPVVAAHRRLLDRLLGFLADDGVLRRDGDRWTVAGERAGADVDARWQALLAAHPAGRGELELTRRCGDRLADALVGAADPLELLFPGGSLDDARRMYEESSFARFPNSVLAEAVQAAAATADGAGRPLRILEIGAGTGGTTSHVLPLLPADTGEYVFTDISRHFLTNARERFGATPFVGYELLDIEQDLAAQGFAGRRFDIVIAANVLHATADLHATFGRVLELLEPGGLLAMVEMTSPRRFIDITFGLTEGWWRFSDTDLRPAYLLLDDEGWHRFLARRGFTDVAALPTASPGGDSQSVIVARASGAAPQAGRRWLLVAGADGTALALADALRARGGDVTLAAQPSAGELARLVEHTGPVDDVVHLLSLDAASATDQRHLEGALALVQALVGAGASSRLWFVTRGAQAVEGTVPEAAQATVWGFAKSVALEHPELQPRCIDLDPRPGAGAGPDLLAAMLRAGDEDQLALRSGRLHAARLERWTRPADTVPQELAVEARGVLENLVVRPVARRAPAAGEVELRVHAAALNFKDVLNALGTYPGDAGALGGECSGTVVAVGPDVTDLHVGDAVVAIAPGSFRTHVTAPAALVVHKPASIGFVDAAGLAIANVTARYALQHVGRLQPGERVLIHAAAGGVGLAAVHLARRLGAEVYATAGREHKRAFLAALGVEHVYDSRSLDFAEQVRADTNGEGVDVVLNSLAGEFVPASAALLRQGGRFLDIGKRDHLDAAATARLGIESFVIDWTDDAQRTPDLVRGMLADTVQAAAAGELAPLPARTFAFDDAQAAFRHMAQARHIGKIVLTHAAASVEAPEPGVRPDGTYLVTGAFGGLGLLTARRLAARGARHLILMGRNDPSGHAVDEIGALRRDGVTVTVVVGDVAECADVARALDAADPDAAPLRGVFHAAGALDDGGIGQQTWARFRTVLAAKVDGTAHLLELTAGRRLDHLVLYSSTAALLGSPGQANHAAANAYLDAVAEARRAGGSWATSIAWGAWSDVGAAAARGVDRRLAGIGVGVIPPGAGLDVLDALMAASPAHVGVTPVRWQLFAQRYGGRPLPPYLLDVVRAAPSRQPVARPAARAGIGELLAGAPAHRRPEIVLGFVRDEAARVLDLAADQVDDRMPLSELGLDSLMAVELRNLLGVGLGLDQPLPATLVFDHPTIDAIATHLATAVLGLEPAADVAAGPAPEPAPAGSPGAATVASMLDALENLSDDEIDRLLEQRNEGRSGQG